MRIAILDPAAGISGDMTLGALLSLGLPVSWLEELPRRLGVGDVRVTVRDVRRAGITCKQIDFAIPEQPHGRHVGELIKLVERAPVSDWVKERAVRAFRLAANNIDSVAGEVFNVGGGPSNTISVWAEFGEFLTELAGQKIEVNFADWRPGDQLCYVSDIRKIAERLGWRPTTDIKTGIRQLWEWAVDNSTRSGALKTPARLAR